MVDLEKVASTAIYLRTSTEEQNPENQLRDCESIRPKNQGYDTFVDYSLFEEKESAFNDKSVRPIFEKIKELIKVHKVRYLIVWDLDRIYRDRKKLVGFFKFCDAFDCQILSFRQQFLLQISSIPHPWNDIMTDLMLNIMGWMAEDESLKKSERVKNAMRLRDGIIYSHKGNKWGRKSLSTFKRNQIINLFKKNLSLRMIAIELGIAIGTVHKIIKEFKAKNNDDSGVAIIDPLMNGRNDFNG